MRVAIVGPGRLGTLLAVAGARAGWRVTGVAGGTAAARRGVTDAVTGVRDHTTATAAVVGADLVLLTVPDDRIAAVVDHVVRDDALVEGQRIVHLAGSRGLDVLHRARLAGARVAACHPAMTVPTGARDPELLVGVAWGVTAPRDDRDWARQLVSDLGGDPVDIADDRRALYHAGLTVASNAVGAATITARRLLRAAAVERPEAFLLPLAEASVARAATEGVTALTGPIVRGDVGTVTRHLEQLAVELPELLPAYRALASATLEPARSLLDAEVVAAIEAVLAPPRSS